MGLLFPLPLYRQRTAIQLYRAVPKTENTMAKTEDTAEVAPNRQPAGFHASAFIGVQSIKISKYIVLAGISMLIGALVVGVGAGLMS